MSLKIESKARLGVANAWKNRSKVIYRVFQLRSQLNQLNSELCFNKFKFKKCRFKGIKEK